MFLIEAFQLVPVKPRKYQRSYTEKTKGTLTNINHYQAAIQYNYVVLIKPIFLTLLSIYLTISATAQN